MVRLGPNRRRRFRLRGVRLADPEEAPIKDTGRTLRNIGTRVRALRLARNLTLKDVTRATGLSSSMLSLVERGQTSPSIGTLISICDALSIHMANLFLSEADAGPLIVREHQRIVRSAEGLTRRIVLDSDRLGIELTEHIYEPGSSTSPVPLHHNGSEIGLVLSGSLEVHLDGTTYTLREGDAIHFTSTTPHRFSSHENTRTVWVNVHNPAGPAAIVDRAPEGVGATGSIPALGAAGRNT